MFFKLSYLSWLIFYEYLFFHAKNLFTRRIRGEPSMSRVELIKRITDHLENINIVYVKVFQSLCLEKDLLNNDEKDFLIKYTDNVPYSNTDIDFTLLDKLDEEFNIIIENRIPVNSGIVGVVFKGINKADNDKKVVIKVLKNGIIEKYRQAYSDLEKIVFYMQYIPLINYANYIKMIRDSKENILNQTDFNKECYNIEFFSEKFKNNNDYILPYVYSNITREYNNIIVMTDITGLKYSDIKNYKYEDKYHFSKLFNKFGILCILFHSCINGDLHAGNIFFYLNEDSEDSKENNKKLPKYQLGIIDFGLCYYPSPENQNAYFTFFYDIQTLNNLKKISSVIPSLIENKIDYYQFNINKKNMLIEEITDCIRTYSQNNIDINFFINLSKIFKSYNLLFTKEFNNICMGIQVTNSIGISLTNNLNEVHKDIMNDIVNMYNLINIDD